MSTETIREIRILITLKAGDTVSLDECERLRNRGYWIRAGELEWYGFGVESQIRFHGSALGEENPSRHFHHAFVTRLKHPGMLEFQSIGGGDDVGTIKACDCKPLRDTNTILRTIDGFTRAYLEAAIWSSDCEDQEDGNSGGPIDRDHDISDFDPETLEIMVADCVRFQAENAETLENATCGRNGNPECYSDKYQSAGHDFWLTRNRHGSGFWETEWSEPARQLLTDASHKFGEFDLYVEDGVIFGN